MKKRPVIGIIASWKKSEGIIPIYRTGVHYIEQVEEAGGLPIQIPLSDKWDSDEIDNYISICDGFIFPGGGDFDPSLYGEEALDGIELDNNDVTIERQKLALEFIRRAVASNKPIIGICLGMQLLNIALGGTLFQDIPMQIETEINHSANAESIEDRWETVHTVDMKEGSFISIVSNSTHMDVNSFHHQAVKDVADGFTVTAWSEDGVKEAIEYKNGKVIGTQWHPENLAHAGINGGKALFNWLIESASVTE